MVRSRSFFGCWGPFIIFGTGGKWGLEPCGTYITFCNKSLCLIKLLKYLASTKQSLAKWEAVCVSEEELTQGFAEAPSFLKSSLSFWNLIFMLLLYEKESEVQKSLIQNLTNLSYCVSDMCKEWFYNTDFLPHIQVLFVAMFL